jgi:DNA-binding Xre family transcriptional regulator
MTVAIQINFRRMLSQKEQRENRKITYTEIRDTTGTPIKTISRWDSGDVTQIHTDVLERFCKYLDCEVGDLVRRLPDGHA